MKDAFPDKLVWQILKTADAGRKPVWLLVLA